MRKLLGAFAIVWALALLGTPAAMAYEVGDGCVGDDVKTGSSALSLNNGAEGFPYQPRVIEAAVITSWRVQMAPGIEPLPQRLLVLAQAGTESERKIAESGLETVVTGSNQFATRIPVPANTWVGLGGPNGALFCQNAPLHILGFVEDPFEIGETREYELISNSGVPVVVAVEEDRDGDGYGDQTQDLCPALALLQAPCPISLKTSAKVTKAAILLTVSTGPPARTYVSGQVAWGFKPKAGGKRKRLIVGLDGGSQDVGYEASAVFTVPLPKTVKRRLAKLPPKKSLKARLNVEGVDVVGSAPTRTSMTVKLPGRAKPRR